MNWYFDVLKQYAVFHGRARRKEYWYFVLFNLLVALAIAAVDGLFGSNGMLGTLYSLAVLLPSIGVGVRRLHDTNRSGWWMLIILLPLLGLIILLIFMAMPGTSGKNDYGDDPLNASPA